MCMCLNLQLVSDAIQDPKFSDESKIKVDIKFLRFVCTI